jgi:nucleotide-binding universal stress UspA family protein
MNQSDNAVVVAVGGSGADAALTFAIAEARRNGGPLHLVHVLRLPDTGPYASLYAGAIDHANGLLEAAAATARDTAGADLEITTERIDNGWVISELAHHADQGRMVVLQHRRLGLVRRFLTGSTVNGVGARASVPVVSVPEDWSAAPGRPPVVTVGIQDPEEAGGLLRTAYEQARQRQARLVVLHSCWLAGEYGVFTVDEAFRTEQERQFRASMTPSVDTLRGELPGVEVELVVRFIPAAEALLAASDTSDLLVLGRRHHLLPPGTHLGPLARTVLGNSIGPVLLAPPVGARPTPEPTPMA